jgi:mevalonate kinase
VVAQAPGKVIITGEHFVVHGGVALAAAIDRGVKVEASKAEGLRVDSVIHRLRGINPDSLPVTKLIRAMYAERSVEPNVLVSIESGLRDGAGLGSSAATMVAAVAAVSRLEGWNLDLTSTIETAMKGEKAVHGKPSGVDVAISAMGGVILFKVGEEPKNILLPSKTKLLVVYSGRKRSTGRLIRRVSSMKDVYPALFEHLCDSSTMVSRLASERLVSGDMKGLAALLTYNHAVLGRVGASNDMLDGLVDACLKAGCYGAKLTGAGGGGSVLAIAPPGEEESTAAHLTRKGYPAFVSEIPCEGVSVWAKER